MANGGSRIKRLAAACLAAGAAVLLPVSPAAAATSLKVEVGYAGVYVPGQPVPVRVQVAADRLVSGELQVLADGVTTSAPVEVPGGSEKEFLLVVPTALTRSNLLNVSVRLPDGSKSPPVAAQSAAAVEDQEVVGLLPGALAGRSVPGPAPLSVDIGTARFVPLSQAALDQAPDSLRALGTVGVGADELGRLAPATRTGILQWVEGGGRLLVDAAPGATVNGLPDPWQPGDQPRARAGAGEVRFTAGAMGAGRWASLIEPTTRSTAAIDGGQIVNGPPLGDSLARDAGFRLPQMSWLVAFLIVYVLVVGPVLFVVLRRRRRPELAWVVIPLVAVLFTGASWAGGRGLRDSTQMVHGTVLATGTTGARALTYLGVSSRSGGTVRIGWPTGWLAGVNDAGSTQTLDLSDLRLTPAGPEGRLPLDANQFGVVSARGPVPTLTGALEITATAGVDGQAQGVIRNTTKLRMDRAAVFIGSGGAEVGPLEPGEQRDWRLVAGNGGRPAELLIMGGADRSSLTQFSLWDVAQHAGLIGVDPGHAVALGWTSEYRLAVRVGGDTSHPAGQTLVVGTANVAGGAARAADLSFARDIVRTRQGLASVYRFEVPTGSQAGGRAVDLDKLSLRSPILPAEVWTGDGWTPLACAGCVPAGASASGPITSTLCVPGGACRTLPVPIAPGTTIPVLASGGGGDPRIPREAVRDGMIYVRFPQGGPTFSGDTSFAVRELP